MARAKIRDGGAWVTITDEDHRDDTADAHDASAISFSPTGTVAATDVQAAIAEVAAEAAAGAGAPSNVNYLVGTADGGLSAEIVVGTTPGGELGNTWASPTVDATHSGSSHAATQAAAEAAAASSAAGLYVAKADDRSVSIVVDGGGSAITTGIKAAFRMPAAGHIRANSVLAPKESGSIVFDVWKDTHANAPPTVADTITAGAKPTISAAQKSEDTTLTGWTTAFSAGDWIVIKVDSITTLTLAILTLYIDWT